MDYEQRSTPQNRDWNTMTSSPASGSTRQLARNKRLAWVSALTLGAGAAGVLGAAAVVSAPSPTAATGTSAATLASGTSRNTGSTLQAAAAPATTNNPPVATSGAS
jgi:hypothetical protein